MNKILKINKISLTVMLIFTLLISMTMFVRPANAALTLAALAITSDGSYTLTTAVGSDGSLLDTTTTGNITMAAASSTGNITIGGAQTSGTVTIGGGVQTGTITLGGGTGAQTVNLGTGGTGVKTINIGTTAVANVITIGTATTTASVTIYGQRAPVITPNGDTTLLAAHSGSVVAIGAAGDDFTLPAPAAGLNYKFVVDTLYTTTPMTIVTTSSANIISGPLMVASTVVVCGSEDAIQIVETAESLGDWIEVVSDGTNWFMSGSAAVTGAFTCTLVG
jgi:hypothetical protein